MCGSGERARDPGPADRWSSRPACGRVAGAVALPAAPGTRSVSSVGRCRKRRAPPPPLESRRGPAVPYPVRAGRDRADPPAPRAVLAVGRGDGAGAGAPGRCATRRESRRLVVPGPLPDRPVMPGVLIVEAMAQTGAVAVRRGGEPRADCVLRRHRRLPLQAHRRAGRTLTLTCEIDQIRGPIGRGKATAHVGDDSRRRGTLTFAVER